ASSSGRIAGPIASRPSTCWSAQASPSQRSTVAISASPSPTRHRRWCLWRRNLLDLDDLALSVEIHDVAHGRALGGGHRVEDDAAAVGGALVGDTIELAVRCAAIAHAGDELVFRRCAHGWAEALVGGTRNGFVGTGHGGHRGVGTVAVGDSWSCESQFIDAEGDDDEGRGEKPKSLPPEANTSAEYDATEDD